MNKLLVLVFIFSAGLKANAQSFKLDYFSKVPAAIKDCSALYTYDTTALKKKKYIIVADFQNLAFITVAGKKISLTLGDTKTEGKNNISNYSGGGYNVVLNTHSTKTSASASGKDQEEGTMMITKGNSKLSFKIHGESGCTGKGEQN
ncbi:MAG: hypothetical protein ABJA78_13125 [Ferruginibacter sp.]